ncbi:SDR family oxidoreductase [Blastomonas fulva]|uniref:SDR family oxidoreductase n=1 Tax=Blastomonas fulva TaxID=1550728 RepID=UPI003F6EB6BE
MNLRYDGRVVVITGAGNGLGKSHALEFAKRGARVVVNDLGGAGDGSGEDGSVASQVVREIEALGGQAIGNTDSVEDGGRIIQQAMDTYGRVDVLINNAGILRDTAFHKLDEASWDIIYRVHLLGAFRTTRAAWDVMRSAGYGRILMTTSAAGIYGNFGQANYSSAKLGIVGLANTLAVEGATKGIFTNTIAPTAASRLTASVMPEAMLKALNPEYVTPVAAMLCHESSDQNGGLFEVGGGWVAKLRWEQARGAMFSPGTMTAEALADRWSEVTSFDKARHPSSIQDTLQTLGEEIGMQFGLSVQ